MADLPADTIGWGPLSMPQPAAVAAFRYPASVPATTDDIVRRAGLYELHAASPPDDVADRLRRLASSLGATDAIGRAAIRARAIEVLTNASIRGPARLVDAALGQVTSSGSGAAVGVRDDAPAPEPANGATLLDDTSAVLRRHIVMTRAQADAIALWVVATYIIDALALMPILLVTAPTMRSGKTTLLTLLGAVVRRALVASNLTGAVLARAIAAFHPTLLADEADTWLTEEASELRGIMNAGHTRPTAYILRCASETQEPTTIPCFGARVIAMIRRPPGTIADRSIVIDLRRKRKDEHVTRLRLDRLHDEHAGLRQRCRRWADDHLDVMRGADPEVPQELHDRSADNWRPLMAIADLAGGDWPDRARMAAVKLSAEDDVEEEASIELLRDVRAVLDSRGVDVLSSAELTQALVSLPDRPWAEWSSGRPMTTVKLAARLRPFGVRPRKVRDGARTANSYERAAFVEAWSRYLPNNSEQLEHASVCGPCSEFSGREQTANVSGQETRNRPMFRRLVPGVPISSCGRAAEEGTGVNGDGEGRGSDGGRDRDGNDEDDIERF